MTVRRPLPLHRRAGLALAALLLAAGLPVVAAEPAGIGGGPPPAVSGLIKVRSGLPELTAVTNAGDARLFFTERSGRIRILARVDGRWRITGTFLDLRGKVGTDGEQGLLGLAFHPDYATNGRFYVHYTSEGGLAGSSVIAEYRRATRGKADPRSRRVLLSLANVSPYHNGGWIGFDGDGLLYIALGDDGGQGDPENNAQNLDSLFGKILRIDPKDPDGNGPLRYTIPAGNPRVGISGRDEIWLWGFRNPWRASIDPVTGALWVGDVGGDRREEIDRVPADPTVRNLGWDNMEGTLPLPTGAPGGGPCVEDCPPMPPLLEYDHADGNRSVTGGVVARRPGAPLEGTYLFGDWGSGRIWGIPADAVAPVTLPTPFLSGLNVVSFGTGADGRVFVVSSSWFGSGAIHRVDGT